MHYYVASAFSIDGDFEGVSINMGLSNSKTDLVACVKEVRHASKEEAGKEAGNLIVNKKNMNVVNDKVCFSIKIWMNTDWLH
jgi:hypothetical protein